MAAVSQFNSEILIIMLDNKTLTQTVNSSEGKSGVES